MIWAKLCARKVSCIGIFIFYSQSQYGQFLFTLRFFSSYKYSSYYYSSFWPKLEFSESFIPELRLALSLFWRYLVMQQNNKKTSVARTKNIAIAAPNSISLIQQVYYRLNKFQPHNQSNPIAILSLFRHLVKLQLLLLHSMSKKDALLANSRKSIGQQSNTSNHLSRLAEKLQKISSSINIENNIRNIKLFSMDKIAIHFKHDPVTQLRNIENKSEINRAEVQLFTQRRPKRYSVNQRYQDDNRETYISIYKKMQQEQVKEKIDTEITSEEEFIETNEQSPSGIKHYNQLRQHPRILQYTLQRLRDKSIDRKDELRKEESKLQLKSASKPAALLQANEYRQIIEQQLSNKRDPLEGPKTIVENQMTKFYSKSSKGKLDIKIKQNARCVKLLEKQDRIVTKLEDSVISKQNMKKLKERLNVIVNQINKDDKNSNSKLPKLSHTLRDSFNT